MASPKEWASAGGDIVEVETPFTMRAKELVELYSGLTLTNLPKIQRVDVLLHVKYTVKVILRAYVFLQYFFDYDIYYVPGIRLRTHPRHCRAH
jgi:hypothetical protein